MAGTPSIASFDIAVQHTHKHPHYRALHAAARHHLHTRTAAARLALSRVPAPLLERMSARELRISPKLQMSSPKPTRGTPSQARGLVSPGGNSYPMGHNAQHNHTTLRTAAAGLLLNHASLSCARLLFRIAASLL